MPMLTRKLGLVLGMVGGDAEKIIEAVKRYKEAETMAKPTGKRDVSLAEERINIPGAAVKTRQFRWVRITPLLEKWLKFIGVKNNGYLVPGRSKDKYESWRQQLAKAAGLENDWPFDGLRHANASFDYALRGDFKAVADNLGNAPEISRKHYIAPATLGEANQFLALSPEYILSLIAKLRRGAHTGH